jgi:hypothetical protein
LSFTPKATAPNPYNQRVLGVIRLLMFELPVRESTLGRYHGSRSDGFENCLRPATHG